MTRTKGKRRRFRPGDAYIDFPSAADQSTKEQLNVNNHCGFGQSHYR